MRGGSRVAQAQIAPARSSTTNCRMSRARVAFSCASVFSTPSTDLTKSESFRGRGAAEQRASRERDAIGGANRGPCAFRESDGAARPTIPPRDGAIIACEGAESERLAPGAWFVPDGARGGTRCAGNSRAGCWRLGRRGTRAVLAWRAAPRVPRV